MVQNNKREKALFYRKQGKTYGEIRALLGSKIPKATLSYWFRNVSLSATARRRRENIIRAMTQKARSAALEVKRKMRIAYLESVEKRNAHFTNIVSDRNTAKLVLAMLYLGEGAKSTRKASLMLGSSDERIIIIYLSLLRYCYPIDEQKFRCTLQCRADQDIEKLERFWSNTTRIPPSRFYRARVDPRTIGKPSKKLDYKGVCRIEYFSAEIFYDFLAIANIVTAGARSLEEKR